MKKALIKKEAQDRLPSAYGEFNLHAYRLAGTKEVPLALVKGTWKKDESVIVRVHSSCINGDVFGSLLCDCGPQLHTAMERIAREGKGVIVYMNHEGRGIGLLNKLKDYKLQEQIGRAS